MKYHPLLLLLAIAPLASTTQAQSTPVPRDLADTIRLERYTEPAFPLTLRNRGIAEGYAQAQLLVAADGTVLETFVSVYSHREFAEAAEAAMHSWKFRPATEPDALPQRFNLRINFRREGLFVVQGDLQTNLNAYLGHNAREDESITLCKLRDLDAIPEPLTFVVPLYPAALKQQNTQGAAAVSFFIDEEGKVRVPSIAGASNPEFAAAALAAVKQWTFNPPLRKGRPTRVFAVQEFTFAPDKGSAENRAATR